ncbi:MAG: hypothetical protein NPIRA03_13230 [Nitrospirales bacterium]|nr:MAG: hypothetical protein NPIRA03_13230 [Nitrospirales bacterium]
MANDYDTVGLGNLVDRPYIRKTYVLESENGTNVKTLLPYIGRKGI